MTDDALLGLGADEIRKTARIRGEVRQQLSSRGPLASCVGQRFVGYMLAKAHTGSVGGCLKEAEQPEVTHGRRHREGSSYCPGVVVLEHKYAVCLVCGGESGSATPIRHAQPHDEALGAQLLKQEVLSQHLDAGRLLLTSPETDHWLTRTSAGREKNKSLPRQARHQRGRRGDSRCPTIQRPRETPT